MHFISDRIQFGVWKALGTRCGGEPVDADDLLAAFSRNGSTAAPDHFETPSLARVV